MRHNKRNMIGWLCFAGMPLRETQAGSCTSSQGNETECNLRGGGSALEGGAQGDRSLRVWRGAGFAAKEMGPAGAIAFARAGGRGMYLRLWI